jgi:OmcA/MtrC family decaheme c-type cytochrome
MHVMKSRVLTLLATLTVAAAGCQGTAGDDGQAGPTGSNGAPGAPGAAGPTGDAGAAGPAGAPGQDTTVVGVATVEACSVCHDAGRDADFAARHAITGDVVVSNQAIAVAANGTDLTFTFNVKVDGVSSDAFATTSGVYRHSVNPAILDTISQGTPAVTYPVIGKFERISLKTAAALPADELYANAVNTPGTGSYAVTLVGAAGRAGPDTYVVRLSTATGVTPALLATAVGSRTTLARSLVSDQACRNCHGDHVFASGSHHGSNPQGPSACSVCHTRYDSQSRGAGGDRLAAYVHGIHNSKAMKARDITATVNFGTQAQPDNQSVTVTKPAGTYARSDSLAVLDKAARTAKISSPFAIGFPGYMNNCSTCHDTAEALTAVTSAPVSWSTCMSCHDGWEGFTRTAKAYAGGDAVAFHQAMTFASGCTQCHTAAVLPEMSRASDFHDDLVTERSGLLWGGKDQSVELGKRVALKIDSIANVGTNLVITWGATIDGNPVDPCNAAADLDKPVFHTAVASSTTGMVASNFSILRTYAQGNDWVSAGVASTSPGQPTSAVNLTTGATGNTTCSANAATTTVAAEATAAGRGLVSIQGKPQLKFAGNGKVIQIRSKSPTLEFLVATGAAPAASDQRRAIVDLARCQACHLGSLYQHGGNRVDSIELCVACHNPASSEQQNRLGMGITAANSYDGKDGQTYDFRTMIHAIHSAGETGEPLVYYRSNGIYVFGSQAAIDELKATKGWPGAGSFKVASSSPATTRTHNEIVVHYPRALNDCQACHLPGTDKVLPDPAKSVAVTVKAGAAPWSNQKDDVLMGPVAAACMSCHQSGVPGQQVALRNHAFQGGWFPSIFENGRQSLLDAAR